MVLGPTLKIQLLVALVSTLLLSGCSSTGLFILNSGLKIGSEHDVTADIQYGEETWQKLDLHVPTAKPDNETPDSKKPVLIFFYGGGWDSGSKEMYYFVANSFAKRGYLVVIPDYAKYPDARFPVFMHDGAAAVAWVFNNISDYGGDISQVVVAGHSAGAHLAALLLSDQQYLEPYGIKARDVKGFAGLAGPYNFTPTSPKLLDIFGPVENLPNMQVNTFIDGDEPEMLLLHGEADSTVGVENQIALTKKLKKVGVPVSSKVYPKVGHIKILMTLTPPLKGGVSTLDDMDTFFNRMLNRN